MTNCKRVLEVLDLNDRSKYMYLTFMTPSLHGHPSSSPASSFLAFPPSLITAQSLHTHSRFLISYHPTPRSTVRPRTTMLSNSKFTAVFIAVSFLATFVLAAPIDEEAYVKNRPRAGLNPKCQSPKAYSSDPLEGCPKNTVFVSQKHPQAKFRSINSALSAM